MASRRASSVSSVSTRTNSGLPDTPTTLPQGSEELSLESIRDSKDGAKLVAFVKSEYERAKQARTTKQIQWFLNLSMYYGNQYAEHQRVNADGLRDKIATPRSPYYRRRKTINRTRSFVRREMSKFLSSVPNAVAVPSTADDEDLRAAYAAEQAWSSLSETGQLRKHYTRAIWWEIITGNGFIKSWWDPDVVVDPETGDRGNIRYGHVTPFHLFVPDLRETDIEDQPYVINAYTKPVTWAEHAFKEQLGNIRLKPSSQSANSILEEGMLNLSTAGRPADSVIVYECWVKPGATDLLPEGGVIIVVDEVLVGLYREGLPYNHGEYPFTKFEHIPTSTFYADSPLVDTNQLQREFNQLRTEISEAGTRMAKPQILAQKGSIIPQKLTNEPGLVIEYRPGTPPPTPLPLAPLPQYYIDQQDRILADWEDITGQHEVSKGSAPPGVTAGTAISFLQEKDNQFLTPQYQSIEDGYAKIAKQTLGLFVQYVDLPRKIKVVGADGAYDTVMLEGSSIQSGTDVRIQRGSSIGESQAAKQARVMDMFAAGLIADPNVALKMLEIGGVDKILDLMSVAERKAQRENIKLKTLDVQELELAKMQHDAAMQEYEAALAEAEANVPADPLHADPAMLEGLPPLPEPPQMPLLVPVADFDVHEVHIESHNKFRMSQDFEALPDLVQEQFDLHVNEHRRYVMEEQMRQQFAAGGNNGTQGGDMPMMPPGGGDPHGEADATMAPEGAPPAPPMEGM